MQGLGGWTTHLSRAQQNESTVADVCSHAVRLEKEIMVKQQHSFVSLDSWSARLEEVCAGLQPDMMEIETRRKLVQNVNDLVKVLLPGSFVSPFGSYSMDLFSSSSDMDLSLNYCSQHQEYANDYKIFVLKKLRRALEQRSSGFIRVEAILKAAVPLVKFYDRRSGIECDISVDNQDAVVKSHFLRLVGLLDSRYHKLCYLVKAWAKAQGINDSKSGTVNSVSWILLVAFHLQTRSPPILPPFCDLLKGPHVLDGTRLLAEVQKKVDQLRKEKFGRNNNETIYELFATFFAKLVAVRPLWEQGLCASTYRGKWIFKLWKSNYALAVEDFGDPTNNVARAVFRSEIDRVHEALYEAMDLLNAPSHVIKSRIISLFGDTDTTKKRPAQELLSGFDGKRQKVTETRARFQHVQGGNGKISRGSQQIQRTWNDEHSRGIRNWSPESRPMWDRSQQVSYIRPPQMFPQNPGTISHHIGQQNFDVGAHRSLLDPYPRYNAVFQPMSDSQNRSRRNRW